MSAPRSDRGTRSGIAARSLRILGVDPGTRTVGYAVIDPRSDRWQAPFDYIECGIIETDPAEPVLARLGTIAETLQEIIAEFEPGVLAIEKAFYGRNAASALKLGQARGAIMLLALQHGLGVAEYAPSEIKQAVVGHGRATKEQVQERVRLLCRLERAPKSDAADAVAIAMCHGHRSLGSAVTLGRTS